MPASRRIAAVPFVRAGSRVRHASSFFRRLAAAFGRYRQRRALADLDDRLLDDIGVARRQAEAECRKPLWR